MRFLKEVQKDDIEKYSLPYKPSFFDVIIKRTYFPVRMGCPFKLGNIIRCLDWKLDCLKCLKMEVYCKNLTGIGRV